MNEWQLCGSSVFKMAFAVKKAVVGTALEDMFGVAMAV